MNLAVVHATNQTRYPSLHLHPQPKIPYETLLDVVGHTTLAAEQIATMVPQVQVVKAFNSIAVMHVADP